MVNSSKPALIIGITLLMVVAAAGCGQANESSPINSPISAVTVSGVATFPDGTPVPNAKMQIQLILDGANLFQPGPGGCTETPAHIAGTVIDTVMSGPSGQYSLSVPIGNLRAAVVRQCAIQSLQSKQVEGLRIKATILADPNSCPAYCSASGTPGDQCVSDCATGNRTIEAADTLAPQIVTQVVSQAVSQSGAGIVRWAEPLKFAQLGPILATGPGPHLVVDAQAAQTSASIDEETFGPNSCEIAESCVRAAGTRRLLRFDGVIENLGADDLVIGDPVSSPLFTNSSCHHVPLLSNIMLYELVDPTSGSVVQVDGQEIVGRKQGFCMMDITQVNASAPEGQYSCSYQGITSGWADVYDSDLECQYLDITGVPPGSYTLRLTVNPDGIFQESDTTDNTANVPIAIPPESDDG